MKIYKLNLSLRECLDKEWIVTNGIGGFASSTVCFANTRRYHGLLTAPTKKNGVRRVFLSKIDEAVVVDNREYPVYTNMSKEYISSGYDKIEIFEKDFFPRAVFKITPEDKKGGEEDIYLEKEVFMQTGKNTVCIIYTVTTSSKKIVLRLTPLVNNRNFHGLNNFVNDKNSVREYDKFKQTEVSKNTLLNRFGKKIKYTYLGKDTDINDMYFFVSDSKYTSFENNEFVGMEYIREKERGFDYTENIYIPGMFEIEVPENVTKKIYVYASLETEDKHVKNIYDKEIQRIQNLERENEFKYKFEKEEYILGKEHVLRLESFKKNMTMSADQFVITDGKYKNIIAGYPWFLDWMRDTMISFEGLLLKTKRYEDAKKVIENIVDKTNKSKMYLKQMGIEEDITYIPNTFDEYTLKPLFNSADSSLLFFEVVYNYMKYMVRKNERNRNSNIRKEKELNANGVLNNIISEYFKLKNVDKEEKKYFRETIYKFLKGIYTSYSRKIDIENSNIYMDDDYLISAGNRNVQLTWMDAKVEGIPVTPRSGKAVEINSMWYNAIRILEEYAIENGEKEYAKELNNISNIVRESFEKTFLNGKKGLKDTETSEKVRPNQLFAISLTYPVIQKKEIIKSILDIVEKKLLNKYGLKTLAKDEDGYVENYEGDEKQRDRKLSSRNIMAMAFGTIL